MKILESTPKRYDWGINFFSMGRVDAIKRKIVDDYIQSNDTVLDIGCGTGTLAIMIAEKGGMVRGIDISKPMLSVARDRINEKGLAKSVELIESSIVGLEKHFKDESVDKIVSTLVFSELSSDERIYALEESRRILRKDGLLIIADEVRPESFLNRILYFMVRWPIAIITFLFVQKIFNSVKNLKEDINNAGFRVVSGQSQFLGAFETIVAKRIDNAGD
jgi:demethylmenaquinone methyltransferase/2-methoxy-6-polyprenyl-1,4-benzoquinol methylase